jgi:hypothetical protein
MADTCTPITLLAGPVDCLDGDCDEYATEDGDPTGIERCSHITDQQACEQHSTFEDSEWEYCTHAEPWPCQHAAVPAAAPTR